MKLIIQLLCSSNTSIYVAEFIIVKEDPYQYHTITAMLVLAWEDTEPVLFYVEIYHSLLLTSHKQYIHECEHCDYKATQQSSLTTHKQSIHEGVKYYCDKCASVYAEKKNLSKHKKLKHINC